MGEERKAALRKSLTNGLYTLTERAREEYRASHPGVDPKNISFKWIFKEYYPGFPSGDETRTVQPLPRDIESWSEWELDLCITAMSRRYFRCEASGSENDLPGKTVLRRLSWAPRLKERKAESPVQDVRARGETASDAASAEGSLDRGPARDDPIEPPVANGREDPGLSGRQDTPARVAVTPNAASHAGAASGSALYPDLRSVLEFHETQLQSLLDAAYQRGLSSQEAAERAKVAEEERDMALSELTSLRRNTEQLVQRAREEGEAAGAAKALQDLFASAMQKLPKSDVDDKANCRLDDTKTIMPSVSGEITVEKQDRSDRSSIHLPMTSAPSEMSTARTTGRAAPSSDACASESMHEKVAKNISRPGERGVLSDVLANLPPPMKIKSRKQSLPKWFVETVLCKNDQTFTSKSSDNRRLEVVDWGTIIRIDPEVHESAPDFHKHGALTFVYGEPNSGQAEKARADRVGNERAESYPVFRYWKDSRMGADGYFYIGHYKVSSLEAVPQVTWDSWDPARKRRIARNFLRSSWATEVLLQKDIAMTLNRSPSDEEIEEMIDELLLLFYREEEPMLQMQHTVLKQTHFFARQCQKVALEFNFDENGREIVGLKRTNLDGGKDWVGGAKRQKKWRNSEETDDSHDASQ